MDTQMENNSKSGNKGAQLNKALIVLVILLLSFIGYLFWQNLELKKDIEAGETAHSEVSDERNRVTSELEEMLAQYKELEANSEELNEELAAEKEKIELLLKQAKGKNWTIHKLRKETETLRTIMKGYVVQIDSLNQANGRLRNQNEVVRTELSSERSRTKNLSEKNENLKGIVSIASHLKTAELKAYGVKIKSNNTGKESDRVKRVGKIRTSFTIQRNDITVSGKKWIYVRILTPDGKVLSEKTDDSNKFDFNGVRGLYSSKKQIDYNNQEQSLTIDWVKINDLPIGEYNVEVYADGVDIGKTKFSLK